QLAQPETGKPEVNDALAPRTALSPAGRTAHEVSSRKAFWTRRASPHRVSAVRRARSPSCIAFSSTRKDGSRLPFPVCAQLFHAAGGLRGSAIGDLSGLADAPHARRRYGAGCSSCQGSWPLWP